MLGKRLVAPLLVPASRSLGARRTLSQGIVARGAAPHHPDHKKPSIITPQMLELAENWPKEYYAPDALDDGKGHAPVHAILLEASGEGSARPSHLYGAGLPMLLGLGLLGWGWMSVSEALYPAKGQGTEDQGHPLTRALARVIQSLHPKAEMYEKNDAFLGYAERVANDRLLLGLEGVGVGNRMGLYTPLSGAGTRSMAPSDFYRASDWLIEPGSGVDVSSIDPYMARAPRS